MALPNDLSEDNVRIQVQRIYDLEMSRKEFLSLPKDRTPKPAKSVSGVYQVTQDIVNHYEKRANTPTANKILFTEEELDERITEGNLHKEVVTFSLMQQEPGAFGQGAPFEARVKNMRPIFREEIDDPANPGYRLATYGYWYDNIIRFTCWAQTNKAANARAEWLQSMFEEYAWYLKAEGVERFLFWGRPSDIVAQINNNRWYGRPLDYFVRTEILRVFSEKTIEKILLQVAVKQEL